MTSEANPVRLTTSHPNGGKSGGFGSGRNCRIVVWRGVQPDLHVLIDNLIEVTEWCMSLDPLSRPQSVFALQKELARETERRYTKLSFGERLKMQLENLTTGAKA